MDNPILHMQRALAGIIAVSTFCFAITGYAAEERANVGKIDANGEIKLHMDRFREAFSDGSPIDDITVRTIDGYLYAARDGDYANGDCRREASPLIDAHGQRIPLGAGAPGDVVYLVDRAPLIFQRCLDKDDRCQTLDRAPLPDNPRVLSARCGITDIDGRSCGCYVTLQENAEEVLLPEQYEYCPSRFVVRTTDLPDWTRLRYIEHQ